MDDQRSHWNDKPPYVPYYWALLKCGVGFDTVYETGGGGEELQSWQFVVTDDEKEWFPELKGAEYVTLWVEPGAYDDDPTELDWHVSREKVPE